MPQVELTASVPSLEVLSLAVSRVTRAPTLPAIARALTDPSLTDILPFEYCCLVVPAGVRDPGAPSWRALRATAFAHEVSENFFHALQSPFAPLLQKQAGAILLCEAELQSLFELTGRAACSALALPLSDGEENIGALCFASSVPDAYRLEDARDYGWLADVVSSAVRGCLYLERAETGDEARRELERLKDGFVYTLVRDVRLPLTSVLGLLELFDSKLQAREPFDAEDRQLLRSAISQGGSMRHLLDDLLEVARQHEQTLPLRRECVEAAALIEEAVEPLRGEAALRGVEINVRDSVASSALSVDPAQARRALRHLLCVALAATPHGGTVSVRAQSITGTRLGDEGQSYVIINVSDSGEGIPPAELPFVFDAFWHVSGAASSSHAGRRLGLAVAKRIAAAHGGNVAVRSQLGAGTTYSIIFPADAARRSLAAHRHVLVVDDAPELLLLLGKLIERMDYRVTTAPSVARALEVLGAEAVDLLITDWAMPEANGGDLISALRSDPRHARIPVVVLTGHDTDAERRDAQQAGCDRFLVKPVMRDELQRAIGELLPQPVAAAPR